MEKKHRVGCYDPAMNETLGLQLDSLPIYKSKGLQAHIMKQKHYKALKYLDYISEILNAPDYIGCQSRTCGLSLEYIKEFKDYCIVLIVRIEKSEKSMYIATMYDYPEKTLQRYILSGHLKKWIDKNDI